MKPLFPSVLLVITSCISTFGQTDSHSAELNVKKGISVANQGNYDSSNYYLEKAIAIYQVGKQWSEYLRVKIYKAENLIVLGKYPAALALAKEVEKESEKRFGYSSIILASAYETIGNVLVKTGNYDEAIEQYWDAELILYGSDEGKSKLSSLYNAAGNAYREKGSYSQALDYFHRARIIYQAKGDGINATIAEFNSASCYIMQEKYDLAIRNYESGTEFLKTKLGDQHPVFGAVFNNIGTAYFYQGKQYPLALDYFLKATNLKRAQFGESHLDVARGYFNQGWAYEAMKSWADSETNYKKAEEILIALFQSGHPLLTWTFNRHAQLLTKLGRYPGAIELYDRAVKANQHVIKGQTIYYDKVRAVETLKFKAFTFYQWYKAGHNIEMLKKALQFLFESEVLIDQARRQTLKESDRLEFGKLSRGLYEQGVEVCYELYRQTKDKSFLDHYFHFSDQGKAVVLSQALEESQALKFAGVPDSLLRQEKENRQYTAQFTQKLSSFDPQKQPQSELHEIEEALFFLAGSHKLLLQELEENYPSYYELKYQSASVSLATVQQKLSNNSLLLSYFITDSLTYVSYTTRNQFEVRPVEVKPEAMEKLILRLRNGILFQQKEIYSAAANQLYQYLFPKPIDQGITHLIIIPDNRLAKIPFEALLEKFPSNGTSFKAMDFLLKRFTVSYAYSAKLFSQQFSQPQDQADEHKGLLAIAPVFADAQIPGVNLRTQSWLAKTQEMLDSSRQTRGQLFNGESIVPLPATGDEIKALYSLFDKNHVPAEMFIGPTAREHILKSKKLNEYGYVHIATHGFVNEEAPELSGILLSQDTSDYDEDNVLYMGEIYNLDLKSELVTLSACETGLGKIVEGEGVVGLTRALLFAGAKNIVVSLWNVNDASTAALMIEFYQRLLQEKGVPISDALQKAKLKLIDAEKFADPYYWSPFILLGK